MAWQPLGRNGRSLTADGWLSASEPGQLSVVVEMQGLLPKLGLVWWCQVPVKVGFRFSAKALRPSR
jgi:hypothetical protein